MSSVVNPVGPDEPSTYWRRRAIVVVVLLFLVWLAWMALSAVTGGSNSAAAQAPDESPSFGLSLSESASDDSSGAATASGSEDPDASGSPGASDSASSSASSSASGSASSTESPSPSGSASPTGACATGDLVVTAVPGETTLTAGSGTSLTLSVANTGTSACSRDIGSGANEIQVLSAGKVVYSTDDCNPSTASKQVDVAPGTPWTATVTWDGRASASGCASGQAALPPGTYQVVARNGSITSDPITVTVQ